MTELYQIIPFLVIPLNRTRSINYFAYHDMTWHPSQTFMSTHTYRTNNIGISVQRTCVAYTVKQNHVTTRSQASSANQRQWTSCWSAIKKRHASTSLQAISQCGNQSCFTSCWSVYFCARRHRPHGGWLRQGVCETWATARWVVRSERHDRGLWTRFPSPSRAYL